MFLSKAVWDLQRFTCWLIQTVSTQFVIQRISDSNVQKLDDVHVTCFLLCLLTESGRQWMICEGFQFILRNQADALLKLGVSAHFKVCSSVCTEPWESGRNLLTAAMLFQDHMLCPLWRLYLQKSQQAYTHAPVRSSHFQLVSFLFTAGASSILIDPNTECHRSASVIDQISMKAWIWRDRLEMHRRNTVELKLTIEIKTVVRHAAGNDK